MDSDDFDPEAVDEEGGQLGCASRDGWAECSAGRCCDADLAQLQHPIVKRLKLARLMGVPVPPLLTAFLCLSAVASHTATYFGPIADCKGSHSINCSDDGPPR